MYMSLIFHKRTFSPKVYHLSNILQNDCTADAVYGYYNTMMIGMNFIFVDFIDG